MIYFSFIDDYLIMISKIKYKNVKIVLKKRFYAFIFVALIEGRRLLNNVTDYFYK